MPRHPRFLFASILYSASLACSGSNSVATPGDSGTPDGSPSDAVTADIAPITDAGAMDASADARDTASDLPTVSDTPVAVDSGPVGCTVFGTLLGTPLAEMDCVSTVRSTPAGVTTDVYLVDYVNACGVYSQGAMRGGSRVLDLHFTGAAITLRSYTVITDPLEVVFQNLDSSCNAPSGESGSTGTVTVVRADNQGIAGSFDVTFNADHIAGTFNAPHCDLAVSDAGSTTCR